MPSRSESIKSEMRKGSDALEGKNKGIQKSLTEWFEEKWVDISRPKEGGGFEPCGREDAESGKYPKCVPASKASRMTPEEISSAVQRKRKAESTESREDKKPINVSTKVKKASVNVPTNTDLYARVKAEAKQKFDVYPSAYANAWLVREYKSRGGKYRIQKANSPAWQREEGKNPKGGLNAKGRASYKAETGGTLKAPVKAGDNPRRASFLARMGNAKGPERNPDGSPTRLLLSLQAWGASSKEDAKAKAKAISARNKPDVEKASFGSRSEAGRYAANERWKGHVKVRTKPDNYAQVVQEIINEERQMRDPTPTISPQGEQVESPSAPQGNISRTVGQIVGRLGLPKGDKYGSTHGWSVRTVDNRTVVNWTNRYGDNPEQSVKQIADALTSKGYEASVSGMKIVVTRPEQVESPSQRVLDTVSARIQLKGKPFPKRERGKNNYYLLLRNYGANHKDAMKEANADDLERKANPSGHAIKDKARKELLQEIQDKKGTPLTVSSHWDMPYN